MKKLLRITLVAAALIAIPVVTFAGHNGDATATANLHPANQSGVRGNITFVDGGGFGLATSGTATGLQTSFGRYVSLVYDVGSLPGGPINCEPTSTDLTDDEMFVGIWSVDGSGNGTLLPVGNLAALGDFDTVSIRDTSVNDGFGPTAVVACGQVAVHPGS